MSLFEPRTAVVTIYRGDYLDRIRHLERRAEAAEKAQGGLPLVGGEFPEYLKLAQEHDDLVREAEADGAIHIRLKHLPRKVWTALTEAHPPRKAGDDGATPDQAMVDARAGVNVDTFSEALVSGGTVKIDGVNVEFHTIVEPEVTAEDLAELSYRDFERLYLTAVGLNKAPVADPNASPVSRMTQKNDETSS